MANVFQGVGSAQKPDQSELPQSRNCRMNQKAISCALCCRKRLCTVRPAAAQGQILYDVSNIVLLALDVLIQTIQLMLSQPDHMVQYHVSPDLRSRYLDWLHMYHDTHSLDPSHNDTGEKGTTDVSIVNNHCAHTPALNIGCRLEHTDENINCLLLMRLFHSLVKAGLFVALDSRTVEIRPRMLDSERPTISDSHVPMTTIRDMEHSVLLQQDTSAQATVIWPSICGIHWTRESDIYRQSAHVTKNTSLVQNGDETTKQTGGYSVQGQEKHHPNTQQQQRSSTWPAMLRRKRGADSEESQDDDERKEPGPGDSYKKRRLESEKTPKFACPFFKHNPTRFAVERACCGPGWLSVNRVK
ncbi:Ff.00g011370.m01.CDS01 [Fusarium sp. VM40]|nr:Ff.00g011370.m01.CDS01 [Fusarium sp. VM40]